MTRENRFVVLVAGGREYSNVLAVANVMGFVRREVESKGRTLFVWHGACGCDAKHHPLGDRPMSPDAYDAYLCNESKGLDGLVHRWCLWRQIGVTAFPAHWSAFGRAAGPRRNAMMVLEKPDLMISFPGGTGTADCSSRAATAGIPVWGVNRLGALKDVDKPHLFPRL